MPAPHCSRERYVFDPVAMSKDMFSIEPEELAADVSTIRTLPCSTTTDTRSRLPVSGPEYAMGMNPKRRAVVMCRMMGVADIEFYVVEVLKLDRITF